MKEEDIYNNLMVLLCRFYAGFTGLSLACRVPALRPEFRSTMRGRRQISIKMPSRFSGHEFWAARSLSCNLVYKYSSNALLINFAMLSPLNGSSLQKLMADVCLNAHANGTDGG